MLSKNRIKFIQSLCQKKVREEEKLFLAEGDKIVKELLQQKRYAIASIYGTEHWVAANKPLLEGQPINTVAIWELEKISVLQQPNQVMALVHYPEEKPLPDPEQEWVLVLDGIQDPGNLGTIIRTCDWFGVKSIVCSNTTVDLYNGKVIQASMGSFLRVSLHYTELASYLAKVQSANSFAAVLQGNNYKNILPQQHGLLLIGNEGKGIQPELLSYIQHKITIPPKGVAESLNASVATGILLAGLVP